MRPLTRDMQKELALSGILLALWITPAASQMPPEHRQAVRQACSGDIQRVCPSITPGGGGLLKCMVQNMAKLSPGCQGALQAARAAGRATKTPTAGAPPTGSIAPAAVPPPPPPPRPAVATPAPRPAPARPAASPAQPTEAQLAAVHQACAADYAARCAEVPPGGGEAIACLLKNANEASPACQDAMAVLPPPQQAAAPAATAPRRAAAPPPAPTVAVAPPPPPRGVAPPPPPPYPPVAAVPPPPPPIGVVLRICDPDRRKLCAGVVPGDNNVIACLNHAVRVVSRPCRQALASLRR